MQQMKKKKCVNTPGFNVVIMLFLWLLLFLWAAPVKSQANEYFPLQLGNTWTYDAIVDTYFVRQQTITIIDTIYRDGKNYFLFDKFFYAREFQDSSLFYIDGEKVFRNVDGIEQLWFDFGARVDSSWMVTVYDSALHENVPVKVTLSGKNCSELINGRYFENNYWFFFNHRATDLSWNYSFAPGIGCVGVGIGTMVPAYYHFRHGTINGLEYPDLINSVAGEATNPKEMPDTPRILNAWPNPFNSSVTVDIFFKNPNDEKIDIYIYNTMGELVRKLPLEQAIDGNHTLTWHAKNQEGAHVSSGIYFVISGIGNQFFSAQKIMYVK